MSDQRPPDSNAVYNGDLRFYVNDGTDRYIPVPLKGWRGFASRVSSTMCQFTLTGAFPHNDQVTFRVSTKNLKWIA